MTSPPIRVQSFFNRGIFPVCCFLAVLTAGVYSPMLWQDFVNFDDTAYITENPHVQQGLSSESIRWALTATQLGNWHPLTWLSLMLDYQLFHGKAWGFKLTNLLLHVANTLLLFLALHEMTEAGGRSFLVAALFAVHPLHVESVAWIAERKDVLSTLFWMLTMFFYARYARRPSLGRYCITLICFILGLAAKPMLVTLPFVLLLIDFWPLGRWPKSADSPNLQTNASNPRSASTLPVLLVEKIPFFVLTGVSCITTLFAQGRSGAFVSAKVCGFIYRAENAAVSYMSYLVKTFWPTHLAVFYRHPGKTISTSLAIVCTLALIIITTVVLRQWKKRPFLAVGWLWYIGALVPVIGLVQVGSQAMADRYTYIPLIGVFIMIAWGGEELIRSGRLPRSVAFFGAALGLALSATVTVHQLSFWKDSVTLNTHAIEVTKDNPVAQSNLGYFWLRKGDYQKAVEHLSVVLTLCPGDAQDHFRIAYAYWRLGRFDKALIHYDLAIRFKPDNADYYFPKGLLLARLGRHAEAVEAFQMVLRLNPGHARAKQSLLQAQQNK